MPTPYSYLPVPGLALAAAGLALVSSLHLPAADWPGWRGARRDGRAEGFQAPVVWPRALAPRWNMAVGEGHASPVVAGGRVYVFTRETDDEVLRAIELGTGKVLWRVAYPAPYRVNDHAITHGPGPKSTPAHCRVKDAERVITFGIGGVLSAFDAPTGARAWQHDFADELKLTSPLFGTALSPLVAADVCVAHVGGHDRGALRAFDVASGAVRWTLEGDGPGYSSPVLAQWEGGSQVITQTQSRLIGVGLDDGKLRWSLPFTTQYDQNSVTVVVEKDLVIYSGYQKPVSAVRVSRGPDLAWRASEAWSNTDVSQFMSSPVLHGSLLLGHSMKQKGQLFCLDAATGKTLWRGRGRRGENAALVDLGAAIAVLTDEAELLFLAPSAGGEEVLASYKASDSPTWAHPVFAGGGVLIKDKHRLRFLEIHPPAK